MKVFVSKGNFISLSFCNIGKRFNHAENFIWKSYNIKTLQTSFTQLPFVYNYKMPCV